MNSQVFESQKSGDANSTKPKSSSVYEADIKSESEKNSLKKVDNEGNILANKNKGKGPEDLAQKKKKKVINENLGKKANKKKKKLIKILIQKVKAIQMRNMEKTKKILTMIAMKKVIPMKMIAVGVKKKTEKTKEKKTKEPKKNIIQINQKRVILHLK